MRIATVCSAALVGVDAFAIDVEVALAQMLPGQKTLGHADATLREALDAMDRNDVDVAVITGSSRRDSGNVHGILTRAQIDAAVRYGG